MSRTRFRFEDVFGYAIRSLKSPWDMMFRDFSVYISVASCVYLFLQYWISEE